jgi:acyl phosphate:glycerol-3-phosphate acyltransferase
MDNETMQVIVVVIISYLLGSLPSAYVVARLKNVNIFEVGSGNMGATNVVRAVGLFWGLVVWLFDSLKGILAILISRRIMSDSQAAATTIAAVVAIIGHNWSLFATLLTGTLRGGKGAATAFGTLLMIAPAQVIVAMMFLFGLIVAITRYVSLGVLLMFGLGLIWLVILVSQQKLEHEFVYYSLIVALLILIRFRENIQRLLEGKERRLGERT